MKGLTTQERQDALKAFVDTDGDDLETLDRSTLDRWASCPWAAAAIESGRVKTVGIAAEAGEAIHHALSVVTCNWVKDGSHYDQSWVARDDMRNDLECELRRARPDLQPEVLKGMMPSAWAWAKFLVDIHPGNILGFDGWQEVGRTGQLAYDFPDLGARATSEIDLLYASKETTEIIEWIDYKTGHATHDVYGIAEAFQFQMHAMLILHHYPDVKAARLRVWDTRVNRLTYAAIFPRSRFSDYEWRVRSAVEIRRHYRDDPPTWPVLEKCQICPAAALCPVADEPLLELADEVTLVHKVAAIEARADALKKMLAANVDAFGRDIDAGAVRFGRNKPPDKKKKPACVYEVKSPTKEQANDSNSN